MDGWKGGRKHVESREVRGVHGRTKLIQFRVLMWALLPLRKKRRKEIRQEGKKDARKQGRLAGCMDGRKEGWTEGKKGGYGGATSFAHVFAADRDGIGPCR
jgi:hypothetical protein